MSSSVLASQAKASPLWHIARTDPKFARTLALSFWYHKCTGMAGGSLPESCQKTATYRSPRSVNWQQPVPSASTILILKVDLGLHCGCRRHPHVGRTRDLACAYWMI